MNNFYDILGVSTDSDLDTIKTAYKKLAKQYHPDRNKDPSAEHKFKEISVAYDTLKDPTKRSQYDLELRFGKRGDNNFSSERSFEDILAEIARNNKARYAREDALNQSINDILNNRWNTRSRPHGKSRTGGQFKMNFDPEDLFKGPHDPSFQHQRNRADESFETVPTVTFELSLDECKEGTIRHFISKKTGYEVKVKIPARVTPEDILKIKEPRVDVHIKPKFRKWKFKNGDVYLNVPISKFKDSEGVEIETILGERIFVKSPSLENIKNGYTMRIKNKGWLNRHDERTNMYIVLTEKNSDN